MPNFIEIKKLFVDGRTYVRTDEFTDGHLRPALLGRLRQRVDLKIAIKIIVFFTADTGTNTN